jgi:hypothetical protein
MGYLKRCAVEERKTFLVLMGRILPLKVSGELGRHCMLRSAANSGTGIHSLVDDRCLDRIQLTRAASE